MLEALVVISLVVITGLLAYMFYITPDSRHHP